MNSCQFSYQCATIEAISLGTPSSHHYMYRWVSSQIPTEKKDYTPVFIMDFSWSMKSSGSDKHAKDALIECCKYQFNLGIENVYVIMFGANAYSICVNENNYIQEISNALGNYNDLGEASFRTLNAKFDAGRTCPNTAFDSLMKIQNDKDIYVVFMTDGQFSEQIYWKGYSDKLKNKNVQIHTIGYQNDHLNNIISMKDGFSQNNISVTYRTINEPKDIAKAMIECCENISSSVIPSIKLSDGSILRQYGTHFSTKCLYEGMLTEPVDVMTPNITNTGVTPEWVMNVYDEIIDLGLYIDDLLEKLDGINKNSSQKAYSNLFVELVKVYSKLNAKYNELRTKYSSIKSRKIPIWGEYTEKIKEFIELYNTVQTLSGSQLTEKKQYEVTTNIRNSLTNKHYRNIQRRRVINVEKQTNDKTVSLESENPVTIKMTSMQSEKTTTMNVTKDSLDETFIDFYSHETWSDLLNSMIGVPFKYVWKSNDDWAPSKAYIEYVCPIGFISESTLTKVQELFGGNDINHEELYKHAGYIKGAHDANNAYLPVLVHPYFPTNKSEFEGRLAHMIIGTNFGFSHRHINLYVAVIKQCFNQLIDSYSDKLKYVTMLLLNTYRTLYYTYRTVYGLDQKSIDRDDVLVSIASGNTPSYMFESCWQSAMIAIITNNTDYERARQKYNNNIGMQEFRQKVWKSIFRHFMLSRVDNDDVWENPTTWGLLTAEQIKATLKLTNYSTKQEYVNAINSVAMHKDQLNNVPSVINDKITQIMNGKFVKLYTRLLHFADITESANFFETFSHNLVQTTFSSNDELVNYFDTNTDLFRDIVFTSYWENAVYGDKDCYPVKPKEELYQHIVNRINSKFGNDVKQLIDDANEFIEFNNKCKECRFEPVVFNSNQCTKMNELFTKVFDGELLKDEFKVFARNILGQYASNCFDTILEEDHLDTLENLYNYCKTHNHSITLKLNGLPLGCPSIPGSPIFLQTLNDAQFSAYFKAVGFGWKNKKYRNWIDTLHPYMSEIKNLPENEFVEQTMKLLEQYKYETDKSRFEQYVRYCYRKYNNINENENKQYVNSN